MSTGRGFNIMSGLASVQRFKTIVKNFRLKPRTVLDELSVFTWEQNLIRKKHPSFELNGKRVLEIGTGYSFSMAGVFWLLGASEVVTIDIVRLVNSTLHKKIELDDHRLGFLLRSMDAPAGRLKTLMSQGTTLEGFLRTANVNYHAPFNLLHDDIAQLGKFDFIYSHSVLEHIYPEDLLQFPVVLKKLGGFQCHFADFKDHKCYKGGHRFGFYEKPKIFDMEFRKDGDYVNRLRISEIVNLFTIGGFEVDIVYENYDPVTSLKNINIHPDFNTFTEKDLCSEGLGVIAREI